MNTVRTARLLLAAGASIAAVALAAPAQAQFSPCAVLGPAGAFMPPPCIKIDAKKLQDIVKQVQQEKAKIDETVNTINQAKAATEGVVSEARSLAEFRPTFRLPTADAELGPLLQGFTGSFTGMAERTGDTLFAGTDATQSESESTQAKRFALSADANAEAYAYGVQQHNETEQNNTRMTSLSGRACRSKDLRTDWAVNSEIKIELVNARARQSHLLSAYLRQEAATRVVNVPTRINKGFMSGGIRRAAEIVATVIDQSDKIRLLRDILAKAQNSMSSLGVVQMASSAQQTAQSVVADYEATVQRKANLMAQFQNKAQEWRNKSKNGSASNTIAVALQSLASQDAQLANLRAQPIASLSGAFQQRGINPADYSTCVDQPGNECPPSVDPRDFIGSWTDPLKYQNTLTLANELLSGSLDKSIEGDDDNDEFRQLLYDYNDVRLEEAWKKTYADEARVKITELAATIQEEGGVTVSTTTTELEALVAQANALGQEVAAGQDVGSKQAAAELLEQLNQLVSGGTSLPSGQVDADGNDYPPPDGVATVAPTTPTTPTTPDQPGAEPDEPNLPPWKKGIEP